MLKRSHVYLIAVIAILALLPLWIGGFMRDALILFFLYLAAAEVWGFMAKHASMVSLGQQIFIGVGGYMTATLCMYEGIPIWASVIVSALIGSGLAGLLSFPLLRLRGIYFSIGSFLAAEVIKLMFNAWEYVGAGKGLIFTVAYGIPTMVIYYPAMVIALFSMFAVYYLYHTKLGFGLRSIGADEDAAASLGVDTFRCKALLFIFSGLVTSLVGAINAIHHTYLHPSSAFSIVWTVSFLFVAVLGGLGTIIGPVVGSAIFTALTYLLSMYIGLSLLLEGLIVLAIVLAVPEGVWGTVVKRLQLRARLKEPL